MSLDLWPPPSSLCLCGHLASSWVSVSCSPLIRTRSLDQVPCSRTASSSLGHVYRNPISKEVASAAREVGMSTYLFRGAILQPAAPRRGWPQWAGAGSLRRLLEKQWLGAGLGLSAGWEGDGVLGTWGDISDAAVLSSQRSWRWGRGLPYYTDKITCIQMRPPLGASREAQTPQVPG